MAQVSYDLDAVPVLHAPRIAILSSKWYPEYVGRMVTACTQVLSKGGCSDIEEHTVPGCIELPLACRTLLRSKPDVEALIVFGVILRGDTYHFDLVKDMSTQGIQHVMFECDVPIINEILPVDSLEHVIARSGPDDKNKGYEAGIAALEIIAWRRQILKSSM